MQMDEYEVERSFKLLAKMMNYPNILIIKVAVNNFVLVPKWIKPHAYRKNNLQPMSWWE